MKMLKCSAARTVVRNGNIERELRVKCRSCLHATPTQKALIRSVRQPRGGRCPHPSHTSRGIDSLVLFALMLRSAAKSCESSDRSPSRIVSILAWGLSPPLRQFNSKVLAFLNVVFSARQSRLASRPPPSFPRFVFRSRECTRCSPAHTFRLAPVPDGRQQS